MKSFQDFCDSLDQDFIDTLLTDTNYVLKQKVHPDNQMLANSFAISMRLLERYHEWLHENDQ